MKILRKVLTIMVVSSIFITACGSSSKDTRPAEYFLSKITQYTEDGNIVSETTYEYDDNNFLVKEITTEDGASHTTTYVNDEFGNPTEITDEYETVEYQNNYNSDGLLSSKYYKSNEGTFNVIEYDYYPDGTKKAENSYEDDTLVSNLEYDAYGNPKSMMIYFDFMDYTLRWQMENSYNDNHQLMMKNVYKDSGELESTTIYEYDENGNKTKENKNDGTYTVYEYVLR